MGAMLPVASMLATVIPVSAAPQVAIIEVKGMVFIHDETRVVPRGAEGLK